MHWGTIMLIWYGAIALILFLIGIVFGRILKKDVLGNGVKLGIMNSFLLSAVWPVTMCVAISGLCYEAVRIWKKI